MSWDNGTYQRLPPSSFSQTGSFRFQRIHQLFSAYRLARKLISVQLFGKVSFQFLSKGSLILFNQHWSNETRNNITLAKKHKLNFISFHQKGFSSCLHSDFFSSCQTSLSEKKCPNYPFCEFAHHIICPMGPIQYPPSLPVGQVKRS